MRRRKNKANSNIIFVVLFIILFIKILTTVENNQSENDDHGDKYEKTSKSDVESDEDKEEKEIELNRTIPLFIEKYNSVAENKITDENLLSLSDSNIVIRTSGSVGDTYMEFYNCWRGQAIYREGIWITIGRNGMRYNDIYPYYRDVVKALDDSLSDEEIYNGFEIVMHKGDRLVTEFTLIGTVKAALANNTMYIIAPLFPNMYEKTIEIEQVKYEEMYPPYSDVKDNYEVPENNLQRFIHEYNQIAEYPLGGDILQVIEGRHTYVGASDRNILIELYDRDRNQSILKGGIEIQISSSVYTYDQMYPYYRDIIKTLDPSLSDEDIYNMTEEIVHESNSDFTYYLDFDDFEGRYYYNTFTFHAPNFH